MGSASLLESDGSAAPVNNPPFPSSSVGMENIQDKAKSSVPEPKKAVAAIQKENKRRSAKDTEGEVVAPKRPKCAAACSSFKEKSVRISDKDLIVETKKDKLVENEITAVALTSGKEVSRANRRLTDFVFHDSDGKPQPVEMLEVTDLFISGQILPLEEISGKKESGVRCEGFGRIETWEISGYEDGSPVIWISTDIADYDCIKPAGIYKKFYDQFFEKARACVEVYKKLSKASGGDPNLGLDELLAGVIRSMSGSKCFSSGSSIRDFLVSQAEFIYNQLIGLDETSKNNDKSFADLPALAALRDEGSKHLNHTRVETGCSTKALTIASKINSRQNDINENEEDEDVKLTKLLQEEEYWQSMKRKKSRGPTALPNKFYIQTRD